MHPHPESCEECVIFHCCPDGEFGNDVCCDQMFELLSESEFEKFQDYLCMVDD